MQVINLLRLVYNAERKVSTHLIIHNSLECWMNIQFYFMEQELQLIERGIPLITERIDTLG